MGWGAASVVWLALMSPAVASAAELAWSGPAECQRAELVEQQVEKLVGRGLSSIDRISFEVEISVGDDGAHRVVLRTLAQGSAPREREIAGASCAEVTDAASVAIALTISEEERQQRGRETAQQASSEPEPEPSSAEPTPEPKSEPAPLRFAVGLGLLMDAGALPAPAAGLDLGVALELKVLRLEAFAAVFAPQDAELPDDTRGGTFDFVLGGVDLCAHPRLGPLQLLACAGFELGRLGARGNEDLLHRRDGEAAWFAPRVEVGVGYGFAEIARVWLRGGIAVPLARPEFVVDDTDQVHQPSSTSFRAGLSVEILL